MKNVLLVLGVLFFAPFALQAQTIVFSDDFESGTTNWTLEGAWGLTTAQSNSASNSLTDSPGGIYLANQNISATLTTGVDLSTALDANLSFFAIYDIEAGNFDYCYVEVSADGGAWVNVATFLGEGNLTPWTQYSYSLGGFVGSSDVRVRFRFFSDGGYEVDGIYIDDVEITSFNEDNAAPLILHTPPAFYESASGDVVMQAELVDISGVASSTLYYSVEGGVAASAPGVNTSGDTYEYTIPEQSVGSQVDYFIEAIDSSPNSNSGNTATYSYIAGHHIIYDNSVVDFVNSFGPGVASGLTGCAVRFSLSGSDIKYALIRNYTDINRPNDDMEFHVWADNGGIPGADLITPFMVTPEATVDNTSPMTRIDLRAYSAELSAITGDVFVGFTIPTGETWVVQTTPAIGNRTYNFDGTTWTLNDDDYHIRLVTTPPAITCSDIAIGAASTSMSTVCFGDTTSVDLAAGSIIPQDGPVNGFRWVVSLADISGSANPFTEDTYLGAFGQVTDVDDIYVPALINDGSQLMAGNYYFTPVTYAGGTGTIPNYDFTDGCVATGNSVLLTLLPALTPVGASAIVTDETTPPGSNGEASAVATGGSGSYTYEWNNGETTATISGLTAGDYSVTVSDVSGCVDPFVLTVTVDVMVGVGDVDFAETIRLFPNPAKERAMIEYSFEESNALHITVTNAVGQVVWQQEAPQGQQARVELDLSNYSSGVYFVEFTDGKHQLTRRLVVNK